jgi:hypothetical protein
MIGYKILRLCSISNGNCSLIPNGLPLSLFAVQNEDTEDLLRGFLHHELEINYRIEFGNVHRFKTRSGDNRRPHIVVRLNVFFAAEINKWHKSEVQVTCWFLRFASFMIGYKILRLCSISNGNCSLIPNGLPLSLFAFFNTNLRSLWYKNLATIGGLLLSPLLVLNQIPTDEDYENTTPIRSTRTEEAHHQTLPKASPNSEKPPSKRQRKGSSPKQGHTNSVRYS